MDMLWHHKAVSFIIVIIIVVILIIITSILIAILTRCVWMSAKGFLQLVVPFPCLRCVILSDYPLPRPL